MAQPKNPANGPFDPAACQSETNRFNECWAKWYREGFLKGNVTQPCKEEWEEQQVCIREKLHDWRLQQQEKKKGQ